MPRWKTFLVRNRHFTYYPFKSLLFVPPEVFELHPAKTPLKEKLQQKDESIWSTHWIWTRFKEKRTCILKNPNSSFRWWYGSWGKLIHIIENAIPPRSLLSKPGICMSLQRGVCLARFKRPRGHQWAMSYHIRENMGFPSKVVPHRAHAVKGGIIHPSFMRDCPIAIEKPICDCELLATCTKSHTNLSWWKKEIENRYWNKCHLKHVSILPELYSMSFEDRTRTKMWSYQPEPEPWGCGRKK